MVRNILFWLHRARLQWAQIQEQDARYIAMCAEVNKREACRTIARLTAKQMELKQRMNRLTLT